MTRRLDDTKVGEYKNNWFFELIQLLIAIAGCVALFIVPITYVADEGVSVVTYLFGEHSNNYLLALAIVLASSIGLLLLNIFLILAIPNVNKSVYVKISKVIEMILSITCFVMLGYYLYTIVTTSLYEGEMLSKVFTDISIYIVVVQLALINSMLVYFNSKKVSIYD